MVKVYYCDISLYDFGEALIEWLPSVRKEYVKSINDEKRKKQSLYVWLLLVYALKDCLNRTDFCFYVDNDAWTIRENGIKFSLSHSDNFVAVAIDSAAVGIDVEKCNEKILKLKSVLEPLNDFNMELSVIENLTLKWTKKESLFKAKVGKNYSYKKIFDFFEQEYIITACSNSESFEFINVDLQKINKIGD